MMYCVDPRGRVRRISAIGDASLFALSFMFPVRLAFGGLGMDDGATPTLAISIPLFLGLFFLSRMSQVAIVRFRLRAGSIPRQRAVALRRVVIDVCKRMNIWIRPRLLWVPRDGSVGARVFGSFLPVLIASGGLSVLATTDPERCKAVIAHELSHIKNRDGLVYLFTTMMVLNFIAGFLGSFDTAGVGDDLTDENSTISPAFAQYIGITAQILWLKFILRRREYYADLRAVNQCDNVDVYAAVLLSPGTVHNTWAHPSVGDRLDGVRDSSPVARPSLVILAVAVVSIVFAGVGLPYDPWAVVFGSPPRASELVDPAVIANGSEEERQMNETMAQLSADVARDLYLDLRGNAVRYLAIYCAFPMVAIMAELAKGFTRKRPATSTEISKSRDGPAIVAA